MRSTVRLFLLPILVVLACGACRRPEPQAGNDGIRVDVVNGERRYTNRLIDEKSPYLQLHAHNPVDWYPWGEAAFEKARREGKAIFLSVGYSTCHWCHVMEAESFSNPEIADYMNRHFVSIKVDREERPDLDRLYMNYVIGVSEGGWPMSLFLTPDLKPFFGANYLPPDDRDGDPGFRTILARVATLWETRRAEALQAAADGTQALEDRSRATTGRGDLSNAAALFDGTYDDISKTFDPSSAGFGGAPRFPRPVVLNFMIRQYARTGNRDALEMTLATLRAMAGGGLRDQLGGGFHRYATDRLWRVPHFEKMLYDQAQLAVAYTEAYQASHDPFFKEVALDTLRYVRRDMSDPDGGFYSAEDADSRGSAAATTATEGAYYVWTADELRAALGPDAPLFGYAYGVEPGGNVPKAQDTQGELAGRNVLYVRHTVAETAARFGLQEQEAGAALERARQRLLTVRAGRPRPPRDDKVLVAWNGLMLSALARSAQAFDDGESRAAGEKLASFLRVRMFDATAGTLKRRYRHGDADIDALLEDYAFLIQGLLDFYEASFDPEILKWATQLQDTQDRLFGDPKDGGYFSTRADAANVLTRVKEEYDGAEPAANSVSAMNLLRLWQLTDREAWRQRADGTFHALSPRLTRSGGALPQLLAALGYARSRPRQIVIAGDRDAADTRALLRLVNDRFMPNRIVLVADGGATQAQLTPLVPFLEGMTRRDGRATIYVCENYACRLPTSDPVMAARLLDGTR